MKFRVFLSCALLSWCSLGQAWVDQGARDALEDLRRQQIEIHLFNQQAIRHQESLLAAQKASMSAMFDLINQVNQLQQDARQLAGQKELDQKALSNLIQDQLKSNQAMESRLKILERRLQLWLDQQESPRKTAPPTEPAIKKSSGIL